MQIEKAICDQGTDPGDRDEDQKLSSSENNTPPGAVQSLTAFEKRMLKRIRERKTVATNAHAEFLAEASFGARLADAIARIGGSWSFILSFAVFLAAWVLLNTVAAIFGPFDPYPFIFLNLILSMIAAIQAPIIMMSQNRQSERDRYMAARDYEINLKAELEVLSLHQKIDEQVIAELGEVRRQLATLTAVMDTRGLDRPAQ